MLNTINKSSIPKKLCFGLMCNSTQLERWQAETVKLLRENGVELKIIILNNNKPTRISTVKKIFTYLYKKIIFRVYNRYLLKPSSKKTVDIIKQIAEIEQLKCVTKQKGFTDRFSENDIKKIKSCNLDFILRFGFNIIRGDILYSAKHGVWSFHHDDENKYRGGPPGFWEIFKKDPVNAVILQKLTDKLDAGIILKKGFYKTINHSYSANIDQIYFESEKFPLQLCKDLVNGIDNQFSSNTKATIFHVPENFKMIYFLLKLLKNKIHFHFIELFLIEDWNAAIIEKPIEEILKNNSLNKVKTPFISKEISKEELLYCPKGIRIKSGSQKDKLKIRWLPKPKNSMFSADPFLFNDKNGDSNIIFENYDYRERKGKISSAIIDKENKIIHDVIEEDYHLSFPFIFNNNNNIYCIPESFENNQISLYKYDESCEKFQFIKPLIENIAAVDTILFKHENLWWLFFTKKDLPSVNLYAHYSEEFDGIFKEHKNNPIKIDIRSSRPAGAPFYYNNKLCRPAQDCAKTYGDKVHIMQIEKLSPTEFKEKIIETIMPVENSKFYRGIHTINSDGKNTVIDGKRFIFNSKNFIFQLKRKTLKLIKSND